MRLLVDAGAERDEDAFYHACEQRDTAFLDALYQPGFERLVIHKLDFEDAAGIAWFLDHGADVDRGALHWAIGRGRGVGILRMLLAAGAPARHEPPTGDREIDALLTAHGLRPAGKPPRTDHFALPNCPWRTVTLVVRPPG